MSLPDTVNVIVQLEHSPDSDLNAIIANLVQNGFVLGETLDEIGVLTGTVAASAMASLAGVPGVTAVEREQNDYHTQA